MSDFEDEMNKPRALATVTTEKPRFHEIAAIFAIGLLFWFYVHLTLNMVSVNIIKQKLIYMYKIGEHAPGALYVSFTVSNL